jgi:hypothetical protein
VYNTIRLGDLRAGRPELEEVLKLPAKSLVIVNAGEVAAIYNEYDENIYQPPAKGQE